MGRQQQEAHATTLGYHYYCYLSTLATSLILMPLIVGAFFIDQQNSPSQEEWSYYRQMEWYHYFPTCGEQSKRQSPINIKRENVITNNQLILKFYNYNRRVRFTIQNAHHTIKMNPIPDSYPKDYGNPQTFDINTVDETDPMSNGEPPLPIGGRLQPANFDANHHHQFNYNQQQTRYSNTSKRHNSQSSMALMVPAQMAPRHDSEANIEAPDHSGPHNQMGPDTGDHELNNNNQNQNNNHNNNNNNQQVDTQQQQTVKQLAYDGWPMIKLDWMDEHNNEYRLHDIHFHWGTNKDNGSEHLIDGRKSAMEMHLVHIKRGLKKDQIGYNSDSVVVIAVLIESYRKSNANFNPIVNTLTSINMSDTSLVIEYSSISDLLPNDRAKFYTYSGSLTTPPCYEVVNWIVMDERVYLNAKQMEMFRNIYARVERNHQVGDAKDEHQPSVGIHRIMPNIRNRQAPRGRPIMASFSMNNLDIDSDNEIAYGGASSTSINNITIFLVLLLAGLLSAQWHHAS